MPTRSDTLHLACAADGRYLPHCAAMLASVFALHDSANVHVHFMHSPTMSAVPLKQLSDWITAQGAHPDFIAIPDAAIADLPRMERIPQIMWYRVLLPDLLPQLDRVLYLDADILAISSLKNLWDTLLHQQWVAAVDNVLEPHLRERPHQLGLAHENDYFNSGVLLFNLAQMRADGCTARILALARNPESHFLWPDQDALNVALSSKRARLHPRWNCQNTLFFYEHGQHTFGQQTVEEAIKNPGLVHFEGPEFTKPWHYLCTHPYQHHYWRCRTQTPWPDKKLDGFSLAHAVIRALPRASWPLAFRILMKLRRLTACPPTS